MVFFLLKHLWNKNFPHKEKNKTFQQLNLQMELIRALLTPRNRALSLGTACSDNPPLSIWQEGGARASGAGTLLKGAGTLTKAVVVLAGLGGDRVRRGGVNDKWGGDTLREHCWWGRRNWWRGRRHRDEAETWSAPCFNRKFLNHQII